MANTFTFIQNYILTSNQTTVTFGSIPATYTDLKLVISGRLNNAASTTGFYIFFNNSNTAVYSDTYIQGSGTAVGGSRETNNVAAYQTQVNANASTGSMFGSVDIYIPNYANTSYNKSWVTAGVTENNAATSYQNLTAGLWRNTAAISSISVSSYGNGDWLTNSSFTLYGIKNTA